MPGRTGQPSRSRPLVSSSVALRGLATLVTLSSFTGISAFAATHLRNTAAPLQPTNVTLATPTPAPTAAPRRTTVGGGIPATTAAPRTRTRSS